MKTIVFLCPHGGAKSVIAAAYFNRLGLPYRAVPAAAEEPYSEVPAPVVEFLGAEEVRDFRPRRAEAHDLANAAEVIAVGCEVDGATERWDDVPMVSDGIEAAAAAIRRHVDELAKALGSGGHLVRRDP